MSITDDQILELADLFRMLGEASRLKIVLTCLEEPRCVSDIAARAHLSQSLVSHHLRRLRAGRILRAERHGKQVFYAPANEHVHYVLSDMMAHVTEAVPEAAEAA